MMKILIVEGGRRNGNTDKIARQFAKGAETAGHEVEIEYLVGKKMNGCIDCQTCQKNGGICIWKDDLPPVFEKMLNADILVFACPVYYYGITAQLKMFIDRSYAWQSKVKSKKLYFITTCAAPEISPYKEKIQYAVDSVTGYADCFNGEMTFVKSITGWDMFECPDITQHEAYKEAFKTGKEMQ